MACNEIHVGDIGTVFQATIQDDCSGAIVDISGAIAMNLVFQKPDGTVVSQTAVHLTDGTDGIMQYVTVLDDLDQAGSWKIQGFVQLPTGSWSTDIHKFKVYSNLQ